jgi:hypothetical protein
LKAFYDRKRIVEVSVFTLNSNVTSRSYREILKKNVIDSLFTLIRDAINHQIVGEKKREFFNNSRKNSQKKELAKANEDSKQRVKERMLKTFCIRMCFMLTHRKKSNELKNSLKNILRWHIFCELHLLHVLQVRSMV